MEIISKEYILQGTNRIVFEPAPDRLRMRVFIGTNHKGEKVKVYVHRIEQINEHEEPVDSEMDVF
ncbi:hypothetical protein [Sphingobacterium multivorum]|uniref:hypothetical protein n=1 Tax=Sphingobacterium multivorum TaxID=28454 RepID=UPI0031BA1958